VLRIVEGLGKRVGVRVWCHALRHTAITEAIIRGQQAGIGLDQIRAFSRHRTLQTMLVYRDARDQAAVHRQLANVVADPLAEAGGPRPDDRSRHPAGGRQAIGDSLFLACS
jgi:integrase